MCTQPKLPKIVRKAVNRNAARLARTEAYQYLCRDLASQAQNLLRYTSATNDEVLAVLDQSSIRWPDISDVYQASDEPGRQEGF